MKNRFVGALIWFAAAVTVTAAEETFSKAVRADDFAAAGLSKLSKEELARLDQLVQAYKSGAAATAETTALADKLAAARREADAAAAARAAAEMRAAQAEAEVKAAKQRELAVAQQADDDRQAAKAREAEASKQAAVAKEKTAKEKESMMGSLLSRAKVVLTPGTEIEYETVTTRLLEDFRGWRSGTVFTLENGQRWQVVGNESYVTPTEKGPKQVKIFPGTFGSFFLEIEGVRPKPKVKFVGGK